MKCKQCGECCKDIGQSAFLHADHSLIDAVAAMSGIEATYKDTGPCAMLYREEGGYYVCLIEKFLGRAAKPEMCRDFTCFKRMATPLRKQEIADEK